MTSTQPVASSQWSWRANDLGNITFNCLSKPAQSWACGHSRLLNNAGSYVEFFSSFAGPKEVVAQLTRLIVDAAQAHIHTRLGDGGEEPTLGIGVWQGTTWDVLAVMGVGNTHEAQTAANAVVQTVQKHADDLDGLCLLSALNTPLFGASDTFWRLLHIGHEKEELRDCVFDAALSLAPKQIYIDPECSPEDADMPIAPNPSDVRSLVVDVNAHFRTFLAWHVDKHAPSET